MVLLDEQLEAISVSPGHALHLHTLFSLSIQQFLQIRQSASLPPPKTIFLHTMKD
jgi:hypothetical protein